MPMSESTLYPVPRRLEESGAVETYPKSTYGPALLPDHRKGQGANVRFRSGMGTIGQDLRIDSAGGEERRRRRAEGGMNMKRDEYLGKLKMTLEQNDFAQVEEAIGYFDELLQDRMDDEGLSEEEAVSRMEAPEMVAVRLREGREKERKAGNAPEPEGEQPFRGIKTIQVKAGQARFIRVRDRNMQLTVRAGEGEDIIIRHPESEKIRYTFTLEDGRLSLIREPFDLSGVLFNFDFRGDAEVTIQVPHELAAELDLKTSNARIELRASSCWGQIAAATSNASSQ